MKTIFKISSLIIATTIFFGCTETIKEHNSEIAFSKTHPENEETLNSRTISQEFKDYWYAGNAEITSYNLSQERYGEIRKGSAVIIFVTEDFLPKQQVKADGISESNIPVLKLNSIKKFITGIYPYSIMTSVFSPVNTTNHAIKISTSSQEWCGQVYMQLNNKEDFSILSHSYFEGEADQNLSLPKTWLENEIWNLIRINPKKLPIGEISMIPAFEYIRLKHKKATAYKATTSLSEGNNKLIYTITYPDLPRVLAIHFNKNFPYEIEKWTDSNALDATAIKTTATKIKRMKTAYWSQNKNKDLVLRDSLGLQ